MTTLADIYSFINAGGDGRNPTIDPYNTDGGDSGYKMHLGYGGENLGDASAEEWLKKNNVKYNKDELYNTDGGPPSGRLNIDWNSLPKTKFGTVNMTAPLNYRDGNKIKGRTAIDEKYVYNDKNYGNITHAMNIKDKGNPWFDLAPTAIMAAASMGLGSLGMPALATAGIGAARGLGNGGDWRNAALTAGMGALGNISGIPPELANAFKYGKQAYSAYNTMNGIRRATTKGRGG